MAFLSLPHPPPPSSTVAIIFTLAFIFFLTVPPHCPGVMGMEEASKKVIGSRPPACVNKCHKCRPCMATLVVPHQKTGHNNMGFTLKMVPPGDDDPYYLLSWKCKCGHKFFQP
ncbi:hypothetical protein QN277_011033 [Acacia crassicarpa]|uniref:Epidermal patterning factor-like protein n=1 Tax=Acacia crassicarpa TaxID=499986 RepID=A0AAE1IN04_9FABA|nr:hypothetical protein QN277_011033 [Acacia crassicarpa]